METLVIQARPGDSLGPVIRKAISLAAERNALVEFDFNDVNCQVSADTDAALMERDYMNAHTLRWKQIGPDCQPEYSDVVKQILERNEQADAVKREKRMAEIERAQRIAIRFKYFKRLRGRSVSEKAMGHGLMREVISEQYGNVYRRDAKFWDKMEFGNYDGYNYRNRQLVGMFEDFCREIGRLSIANTGPVDMSVPGWQEAFNNNSHRVIKPRLDAIVARHLEKIKKSQPHKANIIEYSLLKMAMYSNLVHRYIVHGLHPDLLRIGVESEAPQEMIDRQRGLVASGHNVILVG